MAAAINWVFHRRQQDHDRNSEMSLLDGLIDERMVTDRGIRQTQTAEIHRQYRACRLNPKLHGATGLAV
ncbi:hypothetical protein ACLOJK_039346 [Asimina triloba]